MFHSNKRGGKDALMKGTNQLARTYLILLLFPLVLCLILFASVHAVMSNQLADYTDQVMQLFESKITYSLDEVQESCWRLLENRLFRDAVDAASPEAIDRMDLCGLLSRATTDSKYVNHIYLISEPQDCIYSDQGWMTYSSLPAILAQNHLTEEDLNVSGTAEDSAWHIFNQSNLSPYYLLALNNRQGEPAARLLLTLNVTDFIHIFHEVDAALCCIFNEDFYISSVLSPIYEPVNWRDSDQVSELVGCPVACSYVDGPLFTYLVAVPQTVYNRPLYLIGIAFLLYVLALLISGGLYSYRASKRRYAQLTALIDALPQEAVINTSYNELITSIHDTLLAYRDHKQFDQSAERLSVLKNILYGHYGEEIPPEALQQAELPAGSHYYVVFFHILSFSGEALEKANRTDAYQMIKLILQSLLKKLSQKDVSVVSCLDYGGLTAVFYGADGEALKQNIEALCTTASDVLRDEYSVQVQILVSSRTLEPNSLHRAFRETQQLSDFALSIGSTSQLIFQENLATSGSNLLGGNFFKQEQLLINTILAEKYDLVPGMVSSICKDHILSLRKDYTQGRRRLESLKSLLEEAVLSLNIPAISETAALRLSEVTSVWQLETVTAEVFEEIMSHLQSQTDFMDQICGYIQDHLDDHNLSADAICEYADCSIKRINRAFRAKYDITVIDYVNLKRIEWAKSLLDGTDLTITQIADQVGYNSSDTMARNFRKIEGLTPTEYRRFQAKK